MPRKKGKQEEAKVKLKEAAQEYLSLQIQHDRLGLAIAAKKGEIIECLKIVEDDVVDFLDVVKDDKILRVMKYEQTRVNIIQEKLMPALKKLGLVKTVCKIVIDQNKLDEAFEAGKIDLKTIREASETKSSTALRVNFIKKPE